MNIRTVLAGLTAAVLTLTSHTANAATPFTTPFTAPIGHIDAAILNHEALTVAGWALQTADPAWSVGYRYTIDKASNLTRPTPLQRADVNRAYHTTGLHGFTVRIPLPIGDHTVCVDAVGQFGITHLYCQEFELLPPDASLPEDAAE